MIFECERCPFSKDLENGSTFLQISNSVAVVGGFFLFCLLLVFIFFCLFVPFVFVEKLLVASLVGSEKKDLPVFVGKESSQLPFLQQQSCLVMTIFHTKCREQRVAIGWGWNTLTVLTNCYFRVSNGCLQLWMTGMSIYLQWSPGIPKAPQIRWWYVRNPYDLQSQKERQIFSEAIYNRIWTTVLCPSQIVCSLSG